MRATNISAVPAEVERVRQRIERWRQERTPGTPMPQKLWAAAAKAAQRHGVYRTTRTLGLEYNKLKSMAHRPDDTPARLGTAQFVELVAPAPAGGPQCRIEVEGPAGARMKIELPALASAQLVVGLCQMVWGIAR